MEKSKIAFLVSIIIGLGLIIFAYNNHWGNAFHFDDGHTIETNLAIRNYTPLKYFKDPLTFSSNPANASYRPLFVHSIALDYIMAGGLTDVFWFHLHNFIGHLFLCVLLYFFYKSLINKQEVSRDNSWMAMLGALFFGVLTINAETINYISARSDSLNALWLTLAVFVYIAWPSKRKYGIYLIPFIISFWYKQTSIVFPILLGGYLWFFEKDKVGLAENKSFSFSAFFKTIGVLKWPLIITLLLFIQQQIMTPPTYVVDKTKFEYLITQPFVFLRYFTSFFLPIDLNIDTDWKPLSTIFDFRFFTGMLFVATCIYIMWQAFASRSLSIIGFGLFWFFITLLPTSSVFPLSEVMNDHRVYPSNIGLILFVIGLFYYLLSKTTINEDQPIKVLKPIVYLIFGVLIVGNIYGTRQRNIVWKTEESIWYDAVIKSPANSRALMNYGLELQRQTKYPAALAYYNQAYKLSPNYSYLHANLAIVKWIMNDQPTEIEYHFKKSIEYNFNSPEPYVQYANYLYRTNRKDEAKPYIEKGLKLSPYHEGLKKLSGMIEKNPN